jgi:hypothetical protein
LILGQWVACGGDEWAWRREKDDGR